MVADGVISVVDDDEAARESIMGLLGALGFASAGFRDAAALLASADLRRTSCVIADFRLPGMSGLALCAHLAECAPAIPTILVTAHPEELTRHRALRAGVRCYLQKPLDPDLLLACLGSVSRNRTGGPE
ncbi:response regulator transcription factor [Enterovirga rhinocerotis]|uniref:Response regulator receiver domain-containing protein n=1 Tax=Enterovirga rhinocerotis TaxID=1339210 RepID=A0A4R7BIT2_9HYPH|nr:response regulator [Enterovirga rhinocerotis]TDR85240.1 response regulator receiver domain-containing protein [Enterovirga rhinocerotis]